MSDIEEEARRTVPKMESLTKSAILVVYVDVVQKVGIDEGIEKEKSVD